MLKYAVKGAKTNIFNDINNLAFTQNSENKINVNLRN